MQVGSVEIDLIVKTAKLVEGMSQAHRATQASMEKITHSIDSASRLVKTALGVIGVEASVSFAKSLINAAAKLDDVSKSTGLGVEQLQRYQFAANRAGIEQDEFVNRMDRFAKSIGEAVTTGGQAAKTFETLGVSIRNQDGSIKTAGEVFEQTIEALSRYKDQSQRASLASDLFGKDANKMAALAGEGVKSLRDLGDQAERVGAVLGGSAAESANKMSNQMREFKQVVETNLTAALLHLAPIIESVTAKIAELAEKWGRAFRNGAAEGSKSSAELHAEFVREREIYNKMLADTEFANRSPLLYQNSLDAQRKKTYDLGRAYLDAKMRQDTSDANARYVGVPANSNTPAPTEHVDSAAFTKQANDLQREIDKTRELSASLSETVDLRSKEADWIKYKYELKASGVPYDENELARLKKMRDELYEETKAYERQQATIKELEDFGDRAFSNIGQALTDASVKGGSALLKLQNIFAGFVSEISQEVLKLALLNPFKNWAFGSNAPTLGDVGGVAGKGGMNWLTSLFGAKPFDFANTNNSTIQWNQYHSGGIVGAEPWAHVRRFHTGGLAANEMPAVLQMGEEVLTANDPRHRRNGGGSIRMGDIHIHGNADDKMLARFNASQQQMARRLQRQLAAGARAS